MQLTQPVDWINKPLVSYFVSTRFSETNTKAISKLLDAVKAEFKDAVFCMPNGALHITVLDWICPIKGYAGVTKKALFASIRSEYDHAMLEAVRSVPPITVHFNTVKVSPNTIYIVGEDNGEFSKVRQKFTTQVKLHPDTRQPPAIIHSSLARFIKPIAMEPVEEFIAQHQLDFYETFTRFDLVHSTREPNLQVEVLKHYSLG